jgi:tetratricopeptide (TPR) repeat protein
MLARYYVNNALYYVDNGDYARALPALEKALLTSPDNIKLKEALQVMHDELCKDQQFELADKVERVAKERDPESEIACEHSSISPEVTAARRFNFDVAYRFSYDDNVTFPEEDFATGEADYSHVFLADIFYDRPFGSGWRFFAQGHFLQSLYHQFDQFNQTRLSAVAAIGKTGEKIGWRLPVEVTQDWLDGSTYRTSLVTRPGLFVQFGKGFFGHFYGRIQSDDYKSFPYVEEDRSGDVYGGGVKIVTPDSE